MGSSQFEQVPQILAAVSALCPMSVLDVGCGYGKYGFLVGELERAWKGIDPKIDAIEGYSANITALQHAIYDNIYIGEATTMLKTLPDSSYDLVLAIDILEHFDKSSGEEFMAQLRRVGKNVIISTPKIVFSQGAIQGNDYEIHRRQWTPKEVACGRDYRIIAQADNYIVVTGPDSILLKRNLIKDIKYTAIRFAMKMRRRVAATNNLKP